MTVILDEIQSIDRFKRVQEFCSYARLVKCQHGRPTRSAASTLKSGGTGATIY